MHPLAALAANLLSVYAMLQSLAPVSGAPAAAAATVSVRAAARDMPLPLGGLGLKAPGSARPPMGWTTWCTDGVCAAHPELCTDAEIRSVALAMEAQGLRDAGWNRLNLDDWSAPLPPAPQSLVILREGRVITCNPRRGGRAIPSSPRRKRGGYDPL